MRAFFQVVRMVSIWRVFLRGAHNSICRIRMNAQRNCVFSAAHEICEYFNKRLRFVWKTLGKIALYSMKIGKVIRLCYAYICVPWFFWTAWRQFDVCTRFIIHQTLPTLCQNGILQIFFRKKKIISFSSNIKYSDRRDQIKKNLLTKFDN